VDLLLVVKARSARRCCPALSGWSFLAGSFCRLARRCSLDHGRGGAADFAIALGGECQCGAEAMAAGKPIAPLKPKGPSSCWAYPRKFKRLPSATGTSWSAV